MISAKFFKDYPEFFVANGDNLVVSSNNYSIKQKVRQPQAATVVLENSTGEIKAMMVAVVPRANSFTTERPAHVSLDPPSSRSQATVLLCR